MKCFQIVKDDIIAGLPVIYGHGRPYVRLGRKKLCLSNALLETNPGMRVLNCRVEYRSSMDPLLMPDSESSDLALVAYHVTGGDVHRFSNVVGPGMGIVMERDDMRIFHGFGLSTMSEAVLARMAPGCKIEVRCSEQVPVPKALGWRARFQKQNYRQATRHEDYLVMTEDGQLKLC